MIENLRLRAQQNLAPLLAFGLFVVLYCFYSFLHPKGWSYYATLRRKLRWYL